MTRRTLTPPNGRRSLGIETKGTLGQSTKTRGFYFVLWYQKFTHISNKSSGQRLEIEYQRFQKFEERKKSISKTDLKITFFTFMSWSHWFNVKVTKHG